MPGVKTYVQLETLFVYGIGKPQEMCGVCPDRKKTPNSGPVHVTLCFLITSQEVSSNGSKLRHSHLISNGGS